VNEVRVRVRKSNTGCSINGSLELAVKHQGVRGRSLLCRPRGTRSAGKTPALRGPLDQSVAKSTATSKEREPGHASTSIDRRKKPG